MAVKRFLSHKKRINIIKLCVFIAGVLLLLTPVASTHPQVDMYSMVTSLGLDKSENGLLCTAEVILPEENKGAMGVSIVIDGEGQTLSSALENLSISIGRTLDLSHCALLIVGQEKAAEGIMDEMEYLLSSNRVSPEISLVLSGNKDAKDFVNKLNAYSQKLDADNLIKYTDFGSHNYSQSLIDFVKSTYSKSQSAVVPCIEMGDSPENMGAVEAEDFPDKPDEEKKKKEEKDSEGGGGSGGGSQSGGSQESGGGGGEGGSGGGEKPTVIKSTDKIGAFSKGKLKTVWGAVEGNGLAWSDTKTKHGHIILENFSFNGKTVDKMSCYLVKKKVKMKSKVKDGLPVLQFNVDAQFMVEERFKLYRMANGENLDEAYDVIKNELKNEISKTIHAVMSKSVEDGIDAFLSRDYFYRFHKKQFDKLNKQQIDVLDVCAIDIKYDIKIN